MDNEGLTGADPVSGVEYVDYTKLDAKLAAPFGAMFVKGNKYAAIHVFEVVQQAQKNMVFTARKVLVVGTTVMYLCELSSTPLKVICLCNLVELVTNDDGWVGIKVEASTRIPDLLIKPPNKSRLVNVLQRLYNAITSSDLPVTHSQNIKATLRLEYPSPAPVRAVPLSYVSKSGPTKRPPPAPEELVIHTGPEPLLGVYSLLPSYTEGMPQWGSASGHVICSMNNLWIICSAPVSFQKAVMKSTSGHSGVLLPQSMGDYGGWQYNRQGSWVAATMSIEGSSSLRRERSSTYEEDVDILVSTRGGTQYGLSTPRSPSEFLSAPHSQSPITPQAVEPVFSVNNNLQPEPEDTHELVEEISQLGLRIKALNKEIDECTERLKECQETSEADAHDRKAICTLFGVEVDEGGEVPLLAGVAQKVVAELEKEAAEAEEGVVHAERNLNEATAELDEALKQEASLKQQIAASRTVQQDSKEQIQTITDRMQDLVTRSHNAAKLKESRITQLGLDKASYTKEERAFTANAHKEVTALEQEIVTLEEMLQEKIDDQPEKRRVSELEDELQKIEAECSDLADLEEALNQRISILSAQKTSQAEEAEREEDIPTSATNDINETCSQLHVAIAKMDELENEACNSGTLRWHLERKCEEVDDMVEVVRRSIFSMKELRRVYDQKLAGMVEVLNAREERLRRLQEECFNIEKETTENIERFNAELEILRKEKDIKVKGYKTEVEAIRAKAAEEEEKKRWAFEQQLLLNKAGILPNTPYQADTHIADRKAEIDTRLQEIDAFMISMQDEILALDKQEASMRAKRDQAWTALTQREQQLYASGMHPEVIKAEAERIKGNIASLEANMNGFLEKTQERRDAIRNQENVLLAEKEDLIKQFSDLCRAEEQQDDALVAELM